MKDNGSVFYKDEYDILYRVEWNTSFGYIDVTSSVADPRIPGQKPITKIINGLLYKFGVISIDRKVLLPVEGGYDIIASGYSQVCDFVQINFPCGEGPQDKFIYHLDSALESNVELEVSDGPAWDVSIWPDVASNGGIIPSVNTHLTWNDIWSN